MKIIGLCGRAGSGKSSVSNFLQKRYGAEPVGFAGPLKKMAMDIWGFSPDQVYGDAAIKESPDPRTGITPRWAMQKLGQAARDHLSHDIWVKYALSNLSQDSLYVIEDVRYVNEAEAIYAQGGSVLRLHCTDSISKDAGVHPSEAQVDLIPTEIVFEIRSSRAQGLEHLFAEVKAVCDELELKCTLKN